jgi:hypothetical protein
MERVAGIEPASSAWKADVLPLYDTRWFQGWVAGAVFARQRCKRILRMGFKGKRFAALPFLATFLQRWVQMDCRIVLS